MDFADATLVVLAEELETDQVVTLDERGFRTYRFGPDRAFCFFRKEPQAEWRRANEWRR
jgi:hypothetical protein